MANHKSAVKRARQAVRREQRNRSVKSHVKTLVKKLERSLAAGEAAATTQAQLRTVEGALRRAASKGVIPAKRASRGVARLARRVARTS